MQSITSHTVSSSHDFLSQEGYRIATRYEGWVECLVARDTERWIGRGQDEDEALEDVLHQMFPSRVAWQLLEQQLSSSRPRPVDASRRAEDADRKGQQDSRERAPFDGVPTHHAAKVEPAHHEAKAEPAHHETKAGSSRRESGVEQARREAAVVPVLRQVDPAPALREADAGSKRRDVDAVSATDDTLPAVRKASPGAHRVTAHSPTPPHGTQIFGMPSLIRPAPPQEPAAAPAAPTVATADHPEIHREVMHPGSQDQPVMIEITLRAIDSLLQEIATARPVLARMAPERQRIWIHLWMCYGRAYEEKFPTDHEVSRGVTRVAKRLTELCKLYWPGNVRALQLKARPEEVGSRDSRVAVPHSWSDAAAVADQTLAEHLTKSAQEGLDDEGWADATALAPPPNDPDALLEELTRELESMTGGETMGELPDPSEATLDRLVDVSQRLRWLRKSVTDSDRWGTAMGRLRWVTHTLGDSGARLRPLLDPGYRPPKSWAQLLVHRVEEQRALERAAALLDDPPRPGVAREVLIEWLVSAFDVVETPRLSAVLTPLRDEVLALEPEAFPSSSRRIRRRLKDLVRKLSEGDAPPPSEIEAEPEEPTSITGTDSIDIPVMASLDSLSERLRPLTRGRSALFVSNREDAELEAKLTDLLGLKITWCDGTVRRVAAQCERIANHGYHFVLSATGFQSHAVDQTLSRATQAAKIPLVRVNRGRPLACALALARELGLDRIND